MEEVGKGPSIRGLELAGELLLGLAAPIPCH